MSNDTSEASTFTFTGDQDTLLLWLARYSSSWRIADVTFPDGSVLLYLRAAPFAVQGWSSAGLGQTLSSDTFFPNDSEHDSAASALATLLRQGEMVDALLWDAESAKQRNDPKTRASLLKRAFGLSEERARTNIRFASQITYDIREGATLEVPSRNEVAERLDGADDVPDAVLGTLHQTAGMTMTGKGLAEMLVEAARTGMPPEGGTDEAWRERSAVGKRLRHEVLPKVIGLVLVSAPESARNEALRAVANTRQLE